MFEFESKNPVVNLAFSTCEVPLLAVADTVGDLIFWNLNE